MLSLTLNVVALSVTLISPIIPSSWMATTYKKNSKFIWMHNDIQSPTSTPASRVFNNNKNHFALQQLIDETSFIALWVFCTFA